MAGNVLIKNANGKTVTLQNPDTNLADVVVDTSKIASKQYVDDADALKVALSSFTGTNQSLVDTGYQKLPGGLIIQWGITSVPSGAETTVTLPMAYPIGALQIFATRNVSGIPSSATEVHAFILSKTQIKLGYYNTGGGNASIMWMTLGS